MDVLHNLTRYRSSGLVAVTIILLRALAWGANPFLTAPTVVSVDTNQAVLLWVSESDAVAAEVALKVAGSESARNFSAVRQIPPFMSSMLENKESDKELFL